MLQPRRGDGRRLDLLASTGHDRLAGENYRAMRSRGIRDVRDGLRWHLIEKISGRYDWSSFLPMLRAAEAGGMRVAWDLCHYGWPDDIEIWSGAFVERFARFAAAVGRLVRSETGSSPLYCTVDEISFWAWARAFSSEVVAGSREENAARQKDSAFCVIPRSGKML